MYTIHPTAPSGGITRWLRRAEAWLDDRGKPAWIGAIVLGLIFVWPLGLALLAYMIWSKRMFNCPSRTAGRNARISCHGTYASSGNSAFDAYKADTLRRLEEEQSAFASFLQRLREAKDKSEFDAFMQDRAQPTDLTASNQDATDAGAQDPRPGNH